MVVKLIELIGASSKGWEDAVESAVNKAGESLKHIHEVDVLGFKAKIE
ncbi:MAG: Dodecin, partial [Candidatus Nitrosotenuis sp.]|nr:Dodecin [Candidatus Nitrosotenuis sp.]